MKYLIALLLLLPTMSFAQKQLNKCVSPTGEIRYTTRSCTAGERQMEVDQQQSLLQFARRAKSVVEEVKDPIDNRDLTFFLTQNFPDSDWPENVERSFLEGNEAVVVMDSFRLHKLEAVCHATMDWINNYPHPLFDLKAMRIEFNTGETFAARYVIVDECDFELR
ncbi:hypothetical protein [Pseudoalteromonas ulvae]|uniref:DUF4124 domain-containing protein n=1 Tax=Pseudoalteromonas ulvae TaxID=107327 RepID=A0A244CP94_PSEDV|nr:hypothetical protein [Pseudoalteromonas ulvae]OUL57405.1 hypothetical protein B1199_14675 [Pseudoalteromonas ulvae]